MKPLAIYVTLDCIKLTPKEKLALTLLKGVLYDYYHQSNGHPAYEDWDYTATIVVKETAAVLCEGSFFYAEVTNSSVGVQHDFKKLMKSVVIDGEVQSEWVNSEKGAGITKIWIQRDSVTKK